MNNKIQFGIFYSALGSLWWGIVGVFYFKHVYFAGPIELVIHRTIWTTFILLLTISFFKRWKIFFTLLKDKKKLLLLFLCGFLIYVNWSVWIYAVVSNKLIDASFGYYIYPILSILFGYLFFKESINKKQLISIILVFLSIFYLLLNFESIPWIGIVVAITWSSYTSLRKKINVKTDIGLFIEGIFITPFALTFFYFIAQNGLNDFTLAKPYIMFLLFLAGPITLIPLFLYVRGVELAGLGITGMIFFITPTCQFLLGFFYFNEPLDFNELISFILIWFAVIIYLGDLNQEKNK